MTYSPEMDCWLADNWQTMGAITIAGIGVWAAGGWFMGGREEMGCLWVLLPWVAAFWLISGLECL